jgi:hypothetical protein
MSRRIDNMTVNTVKNEQPPTAELAVIELRKKISQKWPEALRPASNKRELIFKTGLPQLDALFELGGGIPYGQLIEITGNASSGKTSLLFFLLARWTVDRTAAYVDFGNSFFPDAAVSSGVDLTRLLVIKPSCKSADRIKNGIRTAELLLRERSADVIVLDLVGQSLRGRQAVLPINLLHRLRLKTVRAKGLVIFLTQNNSEIIPSSMASLRLQTKRTGKSEDSLEITVTKSRISAEGARVEVCL